MLRGKSMKKITFAIFCALMISAAPLHAEVKSIVDWDGGYNPYKPGKDTIAGRDTPASGKTTCASKCPAPYSITTTSCPEGQILVNCPASGCSYYRFCRNKKDKGDEEKKQDILNTNPNDVNLIELLEEIETFQYDQPTEQEQQ